MMVVLTSSKENIFGRKGKFCGSTFVGSLPIGMHFTCYTPVHIAIDICFEYIVHVRVVKHNENFSLYILFCHFSLYYAGRPVGSQGPK